MISIRSWIQKRWKASENGIIQAVKLGYWLENGGQDIIMGAGVIAVGTYAANQTKIDASVKKGIENAKNKISGNQKVSGANEILEGDWSKYMSPEDAFRYNQYWDDVAKGLNTNTRVKLNQWQYRPDADLYIKNKTVYDNPQYFDQQTGNVKYPGEYGDINKNGFTNGEYVEETLQPGTIIDRYGSNGTGKFFSPEGTSYGERALPPFMENQPYTKYEILKPMKTNSGEIAPWFEQPGGGKQFLSDFSVDELRDMGIIRILE